MRKKSKLFLSMASMVLTVALFCFGVYAALGVSYTISGSVVYQVKDVFVNIQTSLYMSKDTSLTDQSTLDDNVELFETNPDNAQTTTNTQKLAYSDGLKTYDIGTGLILEPTEDDLTSENIPINYGSYEIQNEGLENESAKGYAYYIVVSITNYGTESVSVTLTNNIDPQATNSLTKLSGNTTIAGRTADKTYTTKHIVIGMALNDATKSVSDVNFNVPIVVSKTLIEESSIYERVNANNEPDANGDYLLFGYYPQTLKEAGVAITGTTPNENGYYTGSDGELYALAEDDNYYKVEKLRWRILDDNYGDGTALIVCDTIIDKVIYQPNYTDQNGYNYATNENGNIITDVEDAVITDAQNRVYANNYKHSNLRAWLNGEFYNKFTDDEKDAIVLTTVDNSTTSGAPSEFVCENTIDYVYALTINDVNNAAYGFGNEVDPAKNFKVSEYANAKGVYRDSFNYGYGWLRSPSPYYYGCDVFAVGESSVFYNEVAGDGNGALPALQIEL